MNVLALRCAVVMAAACIGAANARALTPFVFESQTLLGGTSSLIDTFGHAVAVSREVVVVGAPFEEDDGVAAGAAYVFRRDGALWVGEQTLLDPDGASGDQFGTSVAVDAEVIGIGAFSDALGDASGAVHVYRYDGSRWVEEQTLLASDGAQADTFGSSLAISGDLIVVGAPSKDELDEDSGAVYVFRYDGARWIEEQKLNASDAAGDAQFGGAVGISGNVAVIGAMGDAAAGASAGAAYVFRRGATTWVEEQKLLASDGTALDRFGASVAVAGGRALVGAFNDGDGGDAAGAAYVFRRDGAAWVEEQKLLASDGAEGHRFGWSVAISGTLALVGAITDDTNGSRSGSAYLFRYSGTRWVETQNLIASDGEARDEFAGSLALAGSVAVSGATNDGFSDIPAAYIYELVTNELVDLDVKPRSANNSINLSSRGGVPVAIRGSDDFDVNEIDLSTLQLGPNGAPPLPGSSHTRILDRDLGDVNGDTCTDLVRRFRISALGLELGDTEACIRGRLLDGTPFDGCDTIRTLIANDPR